MNNPNTIFIMTWLLALEKQTTLGAVLFWGEGVHNNNAWMRPKHILLISKNNLFPLTKSMSYKLKVQITPKELIMQKRQGIRNMGEIVNFIGANTMALRKAVTLLFITTDVSLVQGRKMLMNWSTDTHIQLTWSI